MILENGADIPTDKEGKPKLKVDTFRKWETNRLVLEAIDNHPGINQYQLIKILGLTKGKVCRGINRLEKTHQITKIKKGREIKHYIINEE